LIGLLFFGALILWAIIALTLGIKLPKWFGANRPITRVLASVVLAPLIFFAPVADEIIAYPQMYKLCESVKDFRYNEAEVTGKIVSKYAYVLNVEIRVLRGGLPIDITTYGFRAANNGEVLVQWTEIQTNGGFLGFPAGSSGTKMPLVLPTTCSTFPRGRVGLEALEKKLRLTKSDIDFSK